MEYTKIRICLREDPKRLYRIIAIKEDPSLYELGAIIAKSLRVEFEHYYYFRTKNESFIPNPWIEDYVNENEYPMSTMRLSDLPNTFTYIYDTGENYEFDCKIFKRKHKADVNEMEAPLAFVLEGAGQGIFENDHYSLDLYLADEINPLRDKDNIDEGYFLPMNFEMNCFGDFDKALDLEHMVYFDGQFDSIIKSLGHDNDLEENLFSDDVMDPISTIGALVATNIFMEPETNKVYRRLVEKYDMNDVYTMILSKTVEIFMDTNGDFNEEFDDAYSEMLKTLK